MIEILSFVVPVGISLVVFGTVWGLNLNLFQKTKDRWDRE